MNIICPFTGEQSLIEENPTNVFETIYSNSIIGKIKIPGTLLTIVENGKYDSVKSIIAGLSRHHFEKYHTPFEINIGLLEGGYKDFEYPTTFDEKSYFLLEYFYENGGAEYKTFEARPNLEYPLAFADDSEEFIRVFSKLEDENLIELIDPLESESGEIVLTELKLTKYGIQ